MDHILVVDDEPSILTTVSAILHDEGYRTVQAKNGREALALVDQEKPALVLLDMRMPVMDGWEFARQLGTRQSRPPVVVMTAARDAREWAVEIGAQGFVSKPFELDDLVNMVQSFTHPHPSV